MAIKKKCRDLKIGEVYRENNKVVPMLRISGLWLEEMGFKRGDYVRVKCENGQIIITPNPEKAEALAAEKAFMDAEMKKLKARYEKEKEAIHARYVAECEANYC